MQKGLMEMTGWRNNENTDGGIGRKDGGIGSRLIEEFGLDGWINDGLVDEKAWRHRKQAAQEGKMEGLDTG